MNQSINQSIIPCATTAHRAVVVYYKADTSQPNAIVHPPPPPLYPSIFPPLPPQPPHRAFGGAFTRSGTSGFTSVTTLKRSSTTLSPVLFPASLIVFSCSSASLLASSSAFLLPLVCCRQTLYISHCLRQYGWDGSAGEGCRTYLLLKILKLIIFLLSVFFYFFLGFVFGVFDALGAVCWGYG